MTLQIGLNIVTLIMCILTLAMASAALLPQIKQALLMLRDGLLWLILIGVVGFVGIIGWGRLFQARRQNAQYEPAPVVVEPVTQTQSIIRETSPISTASFSHDTTFATNGPPTGGVFTPNRSWPTNSHNSSNPR